MSQQTEPLTAVLQPLSESCDGSLGLTLLTLRASCRVPGGKKLLLAQRLWIYGHEMRLLVLLIVKASRWLIYTPPSFLFLSLSLLREAPGLQAVQRQNTNGSDEWSIALIYVPRAIAWKWPGHEQKTQRVNVSVIEAGDNTAVRDFSYDGHFSVGDLQLM